MEFTQPLTEIREKRRPVLRADKLTTICEQIVYTIWDP
jgi:hypothetical protein